jgi:FixJ family two-component response regulator
VSSPSAAASTVHVVDDDDSVRGAIVSLLRAVGMRVEAYASAEDFLLRRSPVQQPGCLLLDVRLPGAGRPAASP